MILGGLGYGYMLTGNETLIEYGFNIIIYGVIPHLCDKNGILHELIDSESVRNSKDAEQFKGIFVRYVMYFYNIVNASKLKNKYQKYMDNVSNFITKQIQSVQMLADNPNCNYQFDSVWDQPFNQTDAVAQTSAIDLFNFNFIF